MFQENKARQIFRKTNIFLPPDTEIWRALFSCNTRFDIRPFALLSTKSHLQNHMRLDHIGLPRIMRLEQSFVIRKKTVSNNMCILEIM